MLLRTGKHSGKRVIAVCVAQCVHADKPFLPCFSEGKLFAVLDFIAHRFQDIEQRTHVFGSLFQHSIYVGAQNITMCGNSSISEPLIVGFAGMLRVLDDGQLVFQTDHIRKAGNSTSRKRKIFEFMMGIQ